MIKKSVQACLAALTLLTTLLFVCLNVAESDQALDIVSKKSDSTSVVVPDGSVLRLIPQKALGFIYCPSLSEFDDRVNTLLTELSPEVGRLAASAKIVSDAFKVQLESLSGLEAIGLDLNRGSTIALTGLKPLQLCVFVPLTDPAAMKATIGTVIKEDAHTEYKGVRYWNAAENEEKFVILGRTLVFSKHREICEDVIDTYNGTMQAITQNPDTLSLLTKVSEDDDQLAVYFDVETAIATLDRPLAEEFELILENEDEDKNPIFEIIAPVLKNMPGEDMAFIEQLQSLNVRLQAEGTDVQIKPSLKFTSHNKFLEALEEVSGELAYLDELPNRAVMNAAFQDSPKLLTEISKIWFGLFSRDTPEKQIQRDALLEEMEGFYESLGDRWSLSFNLGDNPLLIFIYELEDEQKAKAYMDEVFLEKLKYIGAYPGKSILHNRVEIKSYVFPDFEAYLAKEALKVPDLLIPQKWNWYYAFTEGRLISTMGAGPEMIQMALERKAGTELKFSDHSSYQELIGKLSTDNNILLAISPIIAVKTLLPSMARQNPDPRTTAQLQLLSGLLMNLPENYSVGFAAKAHDNSIDAKLLIKLGDFEQLAQAFTTMFQMQ